VEENGISLIWGTVPKFAWRDWNAQRKPRLWCSVPRSRFDMRTSWIRSKDDTYISACRENTCFCGTRKIHLVLYSQQAAHWSHREPFESGSQPHIMFLCDSFLNNLPICIHLCPLTSLLIFPPNFCTRMFYPLRSTCFSVDDQSSLNSLFWSIKIQLL
jgi:hypothetical protein